MYCHICGEVLGGQSQRCPKCGADVPTRKNRNRKINAADPIWLILPRSSIQINSSTTMMGSTSDSALYSDFGWENLQILNNVNAGSHTSCSAVGEDCKYIIQWFSEKD